MRKTWKRITVLGATAALGLATTGCQSGSMFSWAKKKPMTSNLASHQPAAALQPPSVTATPYPAARGNANNYAASNTPGSYQPGGYAARTAAASAATTPSASYYTGQYATANNAARQANSPSATAPSASGAQQGFYAPRYASTNSNGGTARTADLRNGSPSAPAAYPSKPPYAPAGSLGPAIPHTTPYATGTTNAPAAYAPATTTQPAGFAPGTTPTAGAASRTPGSSYSPSRSGVYSPSPGSYTSATSNSTPSASPYTPSASPYTPSASPYTPGSTGRSSTSFPTTPTYPTP